MCQHRLTPRHDEVEARQRIRAVANDITQAQDLIDAASLDLGEDGPKSLQIPVDVADNRRHVVAILRRGFPRGNHIPAPTYLFLNRVVLPSNTNSTVPVGPLRCLATMTSAILVGA